MSDLAKRLTDLWDIPEAQRNKGIELLSRIYTNILNHPSNQKFQNLNFSKIRQKLDQCRPAFYLLFAAGFSQSIDGTRLKWQNNKINMKLLQNANNGLHAKINGDNTGSMISLNRYSIHANIWQRYGHIVYLFDFENMGTDSSKDLIFQITIDPDAFISNFTANIDDELFYGMTKEKEKASKEYLTAKEKNENAILISQPYSNIPNVFEIKINIDSKSKISLKLSIEQCITKKFNFNELNIQILRNFNKYRIVKNYEQITFKLDIKDESGIFDVMIPSSLSTSDNSNDIIIDETKMNEFNTHCTILGKINVKIASINELTLKYKIKGEQNDSVILYDDKSSTFCHIISDIITDSNINNENDIDEGYNDDIKDNVLIPRRVIFVIDKSSSMRGSKWEKTICATTAALKQLRLLHDRYCVILFDKNIIKFPKEMVIANESNINESIQYLQNNDVGGGTNINNALLTAIELIKDDIKSIENNNDIYNFFMNQIVFITDGRPYNGERNTKQIILNVKRANNLSKIDKYNSKISIFSFGVGKDENDSSWINDLNHSFLKLLSLNNNGFYKRIKQISADILLNEYFNILSKPILSNIHIKYDNKNIKNLTQTTFNTLWSGNDIIVCGQIDGEQKNENNNSSEINITATITAITGKQVPHQNNGKLMCIKPINIAKKIKLNLDFNDNDDAMNEYNNIERICAYLKLQQFAQQKLLKETDGDMIEIDDDEKKENELEEAYPLSLAMKYQFVTPWTSMIVVKEKTISTTTTIKTDDKELVEDANNLSVDELALIEEIKTNNAVSISLNMNDLCGLSKEEKIAKFNDVNNEYRKEKKPEHVKMRLDTERRRRDNIKKCQEAERKRNEYKMRMLCSRKKREKGEAEIRKKAIKEKIIADKRRKLQQKQRQQKKKQVELKWYKRNEQYDRNDIKKLEEIEKNRMIQKPSIDFVDNASQIITLMTPIINNDNNNMDDLYCGLMHLYMILNNLLNNTNSKHLRRIDVDNEIFKNRLGRFQIFEILLTNLGFKLEDSDKGRMFIIRFDEKNATEKQKQLLYLKNCADELYKIAHDDVLIKTTIGLGIKTVYDHNKTNLNELFEVFNIINKAIDRILQEPLNMKYQSINIETLKSKYSNVIGIVDIFKLFGFKKNKNDKTKFVLDAQYKVNLDSLRWELTMFINLINDKTLLNIKVTS